jgi:SAM-dependent methyltransferase
MTPEDLRELLTPEGLRLLDDVGPLSNTDAATSAVTRLRRAGHSPALVAAVVTQARLRTKGAAKFGEFAGRMLFTDAGLQQATRLGVAAHHAGRFRAAGLTRIADLGCGIGGDAMAIAALGLGVVAVDRDEVTAAVAAYNLAPFESATVTTGTAEEADLSDVDGVWLDPARRDGTTRLRDPGDWSPSLDFAFDLARHRPTGIKLGPAADRGLIPDDVEAQWVSDRGEVVELALWSGPLARERIRRAALVLGHGGAAELVGAADSADEPAGSLGACVVEPDGAVIRARLIGDLARTLDARMLHPSIAYLTTDAPVTTPFGATFEIEADLPLDVRTLKRELAARHIGTLEIKKRGVDIDPAVFRTKLGLRGDDAAVLILTRVGDRRRALLARRRDDLSAATRTADAT